MPKILPTAALELLLLGKGHPLVDLLALEPEQQLQHSWKKYIRVFEMILELKWKM